MSSSDERPFVVITGCLLSECPFIDEELIDILDVTDMDEGDDAMDEITGESFLLVCTPRTVTLKPPMVAVLAFDV